MDNKIGYGASMTAFRLVVIIVLASIFGICIPMHAGNTDIAHQGATCQEVALQNTIKQQRLDALAAEFTSLSKTVELSLLDIAQKTDYLRFLHSCASKQKTLAKTNTGDDDCYQEQRLLAMELLVESIKKSYLKMQLLTVGLDTYTHALLKKSFDQRLYHQALATIHLKLYSWLEQSWKQPMTMTPHSNNDITTIVREALPSHFSDSFLTYFFADSHAETLLKILSVDLYEDYPAIVEDYLACMEACKSYTYSDDPKTYAKLTYRIDELIASLEEQRDEVIPEEPEDVTTVLNFFITKLFCAKQRISFSQQLQEVNRLAPMLISIFMKHHRIIQSDEFITSYTAASSASRKHLDRYIVLVENFFSAAPTKSLLFVSDVEIMIAGFKNIKPTTPWSREALECMKDALACMKELLNRAQVTLGLKKHGSDPKTADNRLHIFDEMLEVLTSIHGHITQKPEEGSSWSDVFSYIRSGQWLTGSTIKNVIKSNDGNVSLELGNLGTQNFTDFRSAAFQTLVCVSPFLFTKVFEYVKPKLDKTLGKQLDALTSPQSGGIAGNHDKIIAFANNNPEIFKQLNQAHPEILDLLADSLKELAGKPE